ncbi:DUF4959 domain-containing protein [Pedobacter frigiditerrae]|uniref:DUF4959 domain-containing protein n=1 Tax=Pedobacter frigiditerrae TaxID=2530452 RepID=A0A4R0MMK2_9SPHI|nr:DUF5000 domain-containing lipoprotein [Pedobacter frigiditerrae]TCC87940.1 DUF4959 domain-containing protein [Pedobacter frigiditerrae]
MKNFKNWLFSLAIISAFASFSACEKVESYNEPSSTDMAKPGLVTNIKVDNFNGGAYITYDLPNSKNLLYVLARYKINGVTTRETKSSYYSDTIMVDGFAKKQVYDVTLYAVSRAEVKSDPVVVKVNPDTPPYLLLKPTINAEADFGGIKITGLNPLKKNLGIILLGVSDNNSSDVIDQHYGKIETIDYSVRGYAPVAKKIGYYVTDNFGNISDTTYKTVTPFFETILDRTKFFQYRLASDGVIAYGWDLPYLWDGKTDGNSNGWHTAPGGAMPAIATFGLGISAKLSRFVLWERPDGSDKFAYGHGNPKVFSVWGSNATAPRDAQLPLSAPVGTIIGDWINMGNYNYPPPPSGLAPVAHTTADNDFVKAGVSFNFPLTNPKVNYIRLSVSSTWSSGTFAHAMEMAIYGDPR